MIRVDLEFDSLEQAFARIDDAVASGVRRGFEATLESIAATARATTTFTDRTGALRNSIQSDGVTGSGINLDGVVSFAATSERGYQYGLALEFGTSRGIRERRFIRDAIDNETGELIESSLGASLRAIGFEVTG